MAEIVVFLGAGASHDLGLPLTSGILPGILTRIHDKTLFADDDEDRDALMEGLQTVLPGLGALVQPFTKEMTTTLPNVTDVLSSLDHLAQQNSAPGPEFRVTSLPRVRRLLERAIFELLVRQEAPDALHMEGVPGYVLKEWGDTYARRLFQPRSDEHYKARARIVTWLQANPAERVTIVSTNYDIEVEQALYAELRYRTVFDAIDFGTSVREPDSGDIYARPASAKYSVLKLHGSLNWLRCDLCDNLYVNPVGPIAYLSFLLAEPPRSGQRDAATRQQLLDAGANQCHCRYQPLSHLIVAPSFVRDVRDPILLQVWRSALDALRRADTWIIVGYSLPPEDLAIRSLFLRASTSREVRSGPLRIVVVQGQRKEPELSRYRLLLPTHEYFPGETDTAGGLSAYIQKEAGFSA
jgi:NAD-dependent SIR2 family protein deacetylase